MEETAPENSGGVLRRWGRIALVAAAVWLGSSVFLGLAQTSMIFFPEKADEATLARAAARNGFEPWIDPQGHGIGFRSLAAADDPRPRASVLILHGNAGHAIHRAGYADLLRAAAHGHALSVHILEYPGYGARDGSPSQDSFIAAGREALDALPAGEPVVLLGESIGTGVAAALAAESPGRIAGLILFTPFDSLLAVAQHHYPLLPVQWILHDRFPSEEWLRDYAGPVSFIIAGRDSIVPAERGQRLFESFTGPKKLVSVPDADHNDVVMLMTPGQWREAVSFVLP